MNVAALQRTLFRMQHDPAFAARVLADDAQRAAWEAERAGLGPRELSLLRAAPARAYAADRTGRRRDQFLRNVASEFPAARAEALPGRAGSTPGASSDWVEGFLASAEFHAAAAAERPFPLAFRDYAMRLAREAGAPRLAALVGLEGAMAEARRGLLRRPVAARGEVVLAPWVRLVTLAAGTHALAETHHAGGPPPGGELAETERETLLIVADEQAPPPGGLREVRVEALSPLVAAFLAGAVRPTPIAGWRRFAERRGLAPDDVEAVAREYVAERVLLPGGRVAGTDSA